MPQEGNCEAWRPFLEPYFGTYTDQALFVASKESGCQNIKSHHQNSNGTYDYCFMQINNEPSALDPHTCAKRAWDKFKATKYWSQWYAVCTPKRAPKYESIKCK